ncbi:TonB C-terminal domain-containing protein [candidate division KSB1 bacterium]|nr:TonB C-terminal domain-containing protein [candidate division KSB1 bacterium]NIR72660.1 TonB C-terminal domain-containing protein [candidate division KSB1 bacterium]NIS23690.1 TonB C-terminal domain-containing protein [candidate division KSB1 bacterium]NIT70610.1 TonB C-terminal domain-containing protein [candidate division KSB1 bacterium]NIU24338.1 TonB C-terminal domain-containing protein [candidate division KSB1 bacterium]
MKLNFLFSFSLHLLLAAILFVSRPGTRKFEGYPVVIPVEIVEMKPVSYEAPEIEKIQPRVKEIRPKTEQLEGVTLEKKKPEKEEPPEEPIKPEPVEEPKEGKSVVENKNVKLDVEEFPFSYYLAVIQTRVQSNWEPPSPPARSSISRKVVVFFKIQRNGRITDITLETSSGDYVFDQAAVRAVTLANPLPPLPVDFRAPELPVHYEFEQGL